MRTKAAFINKIWATADWTQAAVQKNSCRSGSALGFNLVNILAIITATPDTFAPLQTLPVVGNSHASAGSEIDPLLEPSATMNVPMAYTGAKGPARTAGWGCTFGCFSFGCDCTFFTEKHARGRHRGQRVDAASVHCEEEIKEGEWHWRKSPDFWPRAAEQDGPADVETETG